MDRVTKKAICCVCHTKMQDKMVSAKCGHMFHEECIKKWLQTKGECPNCKTKLTAADYHPLYGAYDDLTADEEKVLGENISEHKKNVEGTLQRLANLRKLVDSLKQKNGIHDSDESEKEDPLSQ